MKGDWLTGKDKKKMFHLFINKLEPWYVWGNVWVSSVELYEKK